MGGVRSIRLSPLQVADRPTAQTQPTPPQFTVRTLQVSKGRKTISPMPTTAAAALYSRFRARFFPTAETKASWWCWCR